MVHVFNFNHGCEEPIFEVHTDVKAPGLMAAVNLPNDSLKLMLPGDTKGKPGQVSIFHIEKDNQNNSTDKMLEVTDGKTDYIHCCLSDCGRYAGFAQEDGRSYRVYDLDTDKMLSEMYRSNTK